MKTYCNPLDLGYRYQHMKEGERAVGFREGADPTLVYFKGKYYLFVSMSAGFWYSDDLLHWDFHADPDLLIYDYAPDVRQVGDYLYFSASRKGRNCPILRTADPLIEPFTEVSAPFAFWDPDMFCDDDGRVYFYWGCSNTSPIWGVELDPDTMTPIGEKKELIFGREEELGYERPGNNGIVDKEASVLYKAMKPFYNEATGKLELPPQMTQMPGLFTREFYGNCYNALRDDGIMVNQQGSPFYAEDATAMQRSHKRIASTFPISKVYQAHIPTFAAGYWLFGFASKKYHPINDMDSDAWNALNMRTRYYTTRLHVGAFYLPAFLEEMLREVEDC